MRTPLVPPPPTRRRRRRIHLPLRHPPRRPAPAVPSWAATPIGGALLTALVPSAAGVLWGAGAAAVMWTWADLVGRCAWGLVMALAFAPLGLIGGHVLGTWLGVGRTTGMSDELARRDWAGCCGIAGLLGGQLAGAAWFTGAYPELPPGAAGMTHLAVGASVLYGPALLGAAIGAWVGYRWEVMLALDRLAREQAARAKVAARRLAQSLTPARLTPWRQRRVDGRPTDGGRA